MAKFVGSGKARILLISDKKNKMVAPEYNEKIDWMEIIYDNYWVKGVTNKTFYDYQIVIFTPSFLENKEIVKQYLWEKKLLDTIQLILAVGGILVIPMVRWDHPFLEVLPKEYKTFSTNPGEEIVYNKSHWFWKFIKENEHIVKFAWEGHLSGYISTFSEKEKDLVIATNLAGNPISWENKFGNGAILFLPAFDFKDKKGKDETKESIFLRNLINFLKKEHLAKLEIKSAPGWISSVEYVFDEEVEINQQIQKLEQKKITYERARSVLWQDGEVLTESVNQILTSMGINSANTEKSGKGDITIHEETLNAVLEVKGLKRYANIDDIRQLIDWYLEENQKTDSEVKGVFVLNHYKEEDPRTRQQLCERDLKLRYPFTTEAIRLAKKQGLCLMSSHDLFTIYKKFCKNEYDKPKFIEIIKSTKGVLELS